MLFSLYALTPSLFKKIKLKEGIKRDDGIYKDLKVFPNKENFAIHYFIWGREALSSATGRGDTRSSYRLLSM